MTKAPNLVPMFGVAPHVPGPCGDPDANPAGALDPRTGFASRPRRRKKQAKRSGPCPTCGDGIKEGSALVCMTCHRVAPDVAARVGRHGLPSLRYDRRQGEPTDKIAAKAKADAKAAERAAKKKPRLTAKETRAILADARAGEHPLPIVEAFLASQPTTETPGVIPA